MQALQCPHCADALVTLDHDGFEIDYCSQCRGVWLDNDEVSLLMSAPSAKDLLNGQHRSGTLRCPVCTSTMAVIKNQANGHDEVEIDVCLRDHGVWFDHGEVDQLLDRFGDHDNKLRAEFNYIFAHTGGQL